MLGLIGLLAGPALAEAASDELEIRVLLYDDVAPLVIGAGRSQRSVRLAADDLLEVQGLGRRRHWRPQGFGPWKVGPRSVRGRIALRARGGRIQVLNWVALEDYVASTVGGEMAPSWPREALRAQAVATRTYALHEAARQRSADWDLRASATSQVYEGIDSESPETRAAARATRREILTYGGAPILAVFHSTAGGRTASAGEVWGEDRPYLRVIDVEDEDEAPHTYWRVELSRTALEEALLQAGVSLGPLTAIAAADRSPSGRVRRLQVRGSDGRAWLSGRQLREILGSLELRSTLFEIREIDGGFAFVGSGYGHGVGMSQWGARAMARRGVSYQHILATFYPGARLESWRPERLAAAPNGPLTRLSALARGQGRPRRVQGEGS